MAMKRRYKTRRYGAPASLKEDLAMRLHFPIAALLALLAAPLLAAEPKGKDARIVVEVKFVSVPSGKLEPLSKKSKHLATCCRGGQVELDDLGVFKVSEIIAQEPGTSVCQIANITVLNGKRRNVANTNVVWFVTNYGGIKYQGPFFFPPQSKPFTTGLKLMVQPTILKGEKALGGERIRLHFKVQKIIADPVPDLAPFTHSLTPTFDDGRKGDPILITKFIQQAAITTVSVEKILVVPDDKTILLRGWTETETICHRSKSILPFVWPLAGLPMDTCDVVQDALDGLFEHTIVGDHIEQMIDRLSEVPLVGDSVRYERQTKDVLLLIKTKNVTDQPKVIIQEEEEERATGLRNFPQ
jgi:hypothetical protein